MPRRKLVRLSAQAPGPRHRRPEPSRFMNPALYWFCTKAAYLNRIPRYGRSYRIQSRLITDAERSRPGPFGPARWSWRRHGYWGFSVLKLLGVGDRYWDEYDRRHGHP